MKETLSEAIESAMKDKKSNPELEVILYRKMEVPEIEMLTPAGRYADGKEKRRMRREQERKRRK